MRNSKHIHIISFDNPFPPDYGGVIDVFFKLKYLHEAGIKITLHAFHYGREPHEELEQFCEKVFYYPRKKWVNPFSPLPYIVLTRSNLQLLRNLQSDQDPIFFEGLHTCYYLSHPALKNRIRIVRMHNIEHDYYENLKDVESSLIRKIFFGREAGRLRRFEPMLDKANAIIAISENDATYLSSRFKRVHHITAFHPNENVSSLPGKGDFALYHGKLSVGENDEAARFLADKVFRHLDYPLIIAGNNPTSELLALVDELPNVKLYDNLNTYQISDLIATAQMNVLPTFQSTGIKLKLINVLYQGRFVVANHSMVNNTGCESMCQLANTPEQFIETINKLRSQEFTQEEIESRKKILSRHFDNRENAKALKKIIESDIL